MMTALSNTAYSFGAISSQSANYSRMEHQLKFIENYLANIKQTVC